MTTIEEARRLAEMTTDEFNKQFIEFIDVQVVPKSNVVKIQAIKELLADLTTYINLTDSNPYRQESRDNALEIYAPNLNPIADRLTQNGFSFIYHDEFLIVPL